MPNSDTSKLVNISALKVACRDCNLYQLCLPLGLDNDDLDRLDKIIERRKPVRRGEALFEASNHFRAIYAVRSGSIKTFSIDEHGNEQVTGFHLPGELLGLDAINTGKHPCTARALETSSVCEIPFEKLEELSNSIPGLQRQMLRIMSKEIQHDQGLMTLLGKKTAEQRVASFLMSLSGRLKQRGFSVRDFNLSMSRSDIGNYLGLAVETVSRIFTRFQTDGLLTVRRKHILIHDLEKLSTIAEQPSPLQQVTP